MERKEIVRHDNGSVTTEGDGMNRYLGHKFDHDKGKGDDEAHCDTYDHEAMHNIPHNSPPYRSNIIDDVKDAWNKRARGAKPLSSIPEKNVPEPMGHPAPADKAESTRPM
jgi:hypothetical protein